jgi:flagellar biosynthetic protein FliO
MHGMRVAPQRLSFSSASYRFLNATVQSCIVHTNRIKRVCGLFALGAMQLTAAAWSAPFAAPEQVAPSNSSSGLLRVIIALLVVLGAVIAAGRFARRMRGFSGGSNSALEVIGQLSVGARERAVLIRVGERQLLLGVAPGSVRALHVFDDMPVAREVTAEAAANQTDPSSPARPSFKALLLKSLGK